MNFIMALSLSILVYNFAEILLRFINRKYITYKKRLDIIKEESLLGYGGRKKKKQKLRIAVPDKLRENLMMAGLQLRPEEFVIIWVVAMIIPSLIASILNKGILLVFILILFGFIGPPMFISIKTKKRKETFNNQLGDVLMLLSNSLRAGFTFEQALRSVAEDLPDPIGTEFMRIVRDIELGGDLERAMDDVVNRMQSKDMELINTAVSIQRKVGGNLSNILDNISETIMDRIMIKKKINTLTAQGRISGLIISILPIVLIILISIINPEYMEPMFTTTYGHILLGLSVIMELLGLIFIKKTIDIEM